MELAAYLTAMHTNSGLKLSVEISQIPGGSVVENGNSAKVVRMAQRAQDNREMVGHTQREMIMLKDFAVLAHPNTMFYQEFVSWSRNIAWKELLQ
ncbi:hypothetical protein [Embleya scabrispora]|uniref:hypothetical protein n=1 Tax=Embleya scabrispora TaxID=159449 RepID=UPI001319E91A|nr:hypothetical protein [Embleya scabrispora]MYS80180.1 hypothetical protein [Streptomyces sp. SID5474]